MSKRGLFARLYASNQTPIRVKTRLPKRNLEPGKRRPASPLGRPKGRPKTHPTRTKANRPPAISRGRAADAVRWFGGVRPEGEARAGSSALRGLIVRRRRAIAVLCHERVELFLVLGVPQAGEEFFELLLLLLEAPQRVGAIFVEGAVTAGRRAEAEAGALHAVLHPLHLPLHPFHPVLPAILVAPASHASAPECEKEKG